MGHISWCRAAGKALACTQPCRPATARALIISSCLQSLCRMQHPQHAPAEACTCLHSFHHHHTDCALRSGAQRPAATAMTALSASPGVKVLVQVDISPVPSSGPSFSLKAFTRAASHPGPRSSMRRRSCTLQTRRGRQCGKCCRYSAQMSAHHWLDHDCWPYLGPCTPASSAADDRCCGEPSGASHAHKPCAHS